MASRIFQFVFSLAFELPARVKSLDALIVGLDRSGKTILARMADTPDTPANRDKLNHIIGIERWGQRRLRVLLGEPFVQDEYDAYRPDPALDMPALCDLFAQVRAASVAQARKLEKQGIAKTARVKHNDAGELSVGGWLSYLNSHAGIESRTIR